MDYDDYIPIEKEDFNDIIGDRLRIITIKKVNAALDITCCVQRF